MTAGRLRWGIAGTGSAAKAMARALHAAPAADLVAVGSRTAASASQFAVELEVAQAHASYEELAGDPRVDAVYVATPHHRHCADTIAFLDAGKHVLCEKPMATSAAQVAAMIDAAGRNGRFLMEAMGTRFLPAVREVARLVESGAIGDVRHVDASLGAEFRVDPSHRLFDPMAAGGSLLDLGVYPIQLVHLVLGTPVRVTGQAHIGETGVDELAVVTLAFESGALGVCQSAITANLACSARIAGTGGVIEIPALMHCPDAIVLDASGERERMELPIGEHGFSHEVAEVCARIQAGELESQVMPLVESLAIARTLDAARASIGLR